MTFKLGRWPARHTLRSMRSALVMARALDPLGAPPAASNDYTAAVTVPWGILRNDTLSDCVCADTGHTLMLRTANASSIVVPTDNDVLALYEAVGGYVPGDASTDNGCVEADMCTYLQKTGFLGHRSDATGSIDPGNLDHLRWCVQLFGACRIGVNLPQSAMDQFDAGQPWDVGGDATIVGGHDVPIVKYDGDYFYVVTWGKLQPVTPAFITAYNEEAHAELFADWVRSQGTAPSGLDLEDLATKLAQIDMPVAA
jgi:hypothetical protein